MADNERWIPARACAIEKAASDENAQYIFEFLRLCGGIVDANGSPIDLDQLAYARLPESLEAPNTFLVGPRDGLDRVVFNPEKREYVIIQLGVLGEHGVVEEIREFRVTGSGRISELVRYDGDQVKSRFIETPSGVGCLPNPFDKQSVRSMSLVLIKCGPEREDFPAGTIAINCALPVSVGQ